MQQLSRPTGLGTRFGMQAAGKPCATRLNSRPGPQVASETSATCSGSSFWTCCRRLDRQPGVTGRLAPVRAASHSNGASNGATVQATLPSPLPNIPPATSDPAASNHHGGDGDSNGMSNKEVLSQQLEALAGKYGQADERLDSLERTLAEVMKEIKHRRGRSMAKKQQAQQEEQQQQDQGRGGDSAAGEHHGSPRHNGTTASGPAATIQALNSQGLGSSSDGGEDDHTLSETDDDDDDGGGLNLSKIQSNITETVNGGYLESMRNLRQTLMASEWDMQAKHWARRRGVSNFELHCATNGIEVDFNAISKLYENPERLDVLPDVKQRLLARAMILQAVDDRHKEVYKECTDLAKELASQGLKDLLPEAPAGLTDLIKGFLPSIPFLKK